VEQSNVEVSRSLVTHRGMRLREDLSAEGYRPLFGFTLDQNLSSVLLDYPWAALEEDGDVGGGRAQGLLSSHDGTTLGLCDLADPNLVNPRPKSRHRDTVEMRSCHTS
jgi:hypothetical protein